MLLRHHRHLVRTRIPVCFFAGILALVFAVSCNKGASSKSGDNKEEPGNPTGKKTTKSPSPPQKSGPGLSVPGPVNQFNVQTYTRAGIKKPLTKYVGDKVTMKSGFVWHFPKKSVLTFCKNVCDCSLSSMDGSLTLTVGLGNLSAEQKAGAKPLAGKYKLGFASIYVNKYNAWFLLNSNSTLREIEYTSGKLVAGTTITGVVKLNDKGKRPLAFRKGTYSYIVGNFKAVVCPRKK